MIATIRLPRLILPKLYVRARLRAPRVAPLGKLLLPMKYQEPYTPEIVTWIVFFSHLKCGQWRTSQADEHSAYSVIQYMAKVTKTISPMTFPLEHPPAPVLHAGLFPGWYLT